MFFAEAYKEIRARIFFLNKCSVSFVKLIGITDFHKIVARFYPHIHSNGRKIKYAQNSNRRRQKGYSLGAI